MGDVSQPGLAVGAADGGGEPGPRAEVPRVGEAGDVADFGDHQQRGVAADAADLAEHVDVGVLAGAPVDLGAGRVDLAGEVRDQRQQAVEPPARVGAQLDLGAESCAGRPEEVAIGALDAVLGQDRADAVLQRRAHAA